MRIALDFEEEDIERICSVLCLCVSLTGGLPTAPAQIPPGGVKTAQFTSLPVRIRQDSDVTSRWKLHNAALRESIIGVWGVLDIENDSTLTMKFARFYAEYFDAAGRLCFTLVFATQANADNLEKDERPIRPGESRQLLSLASALGPASDPVEVRVRLIQDTISAEPLRGAVGDAVIGSPVVINAAVPRRYLRLKLAPLQESPAIIDLLFAKLRFGPAGDLQGFEVLQSSNAEARSWFEGFLRQKRLGNPATVGLANVAGIALVLLRAPNRLEGTPAAELLPRSSSWVKSYAQAVQGADIPPITQLLLSRSADLIPLPTRLPDGTIQQRERVTDQDLFEYISPGSDWCGTIMEWDSRSGIPVLKWRITR